MSQKLEEQQRIAAELKQQLQSLEMERQTITEKISVAEAKLEVQELQDKVEIKKKIVNQLREKLKDLEEKLKLHKPTVVEEQTQMTPPQEETQPQRSYF